MPRWQSIVDLVVMALAIYLFLRWTTGNRLRNLILGIAALFAGGSLASQLDLPFTGWILNAAGFVAVLFLVTVFQTELRHLMMRTEGWLRRSNSRYGGVEYHEVLTRSAFALSETRVGAIIVLVREHSLDELSTGGVRIGAPISAELLEAIFQKQSLMHDGAVIVDQGRILRAGALLPLTHRADVPAGFGTRHRAALGICERCDASAVVVSEQRGEVTFVSGRHWRHARTTHELMDALRTSHVAKNESRPSLMRGLLLSHPKQRLAALGLTALIWMVSLLTINTAIRDFSVPIEFTNLAAGLDISRPSVKQLDVRVRGPRWIVESLRASQLSARFDLKGVSQGTHVLARPGDVVNLPAGVLVERVSPPEVQVRVVPVAGVGYR
jgi:diadenylate cyclase